MRPDISELERFYAGRQGDAVRRLVALKLRHVWTPAPGERLLGIGFATPFMEAFAASETKIAVMPATQGASPRTGTTPGVVLAREDELPFPDRAFDKLLLIHALECSPHPNRLLREAWRVLADGGRLLTVVPNRTGLWCWSEKTPFGYGQPYTASQLERLLQSHLFAPQDARRALWLPPWRGGTRFIIPAERIGGYLAPRLSGVLMIEAEKRIWLAPPAQEALRPSSRRYYMPVPSAARDGERSASAARGFLSAFFRFVRGWFRR